MKTTTGRRAPVDLPGPEGDNAIAREPLWYAYAAGDDEPEPPLWTWAEEPPPESHVAPPPPPAVPHGTPVRLPPGTADLLARTPFPAGRVAGVSTVEESVGHALLTAFGVQRHEPGNPFNDHRAYASPRCLFPVCVFAGDGMRWRRLDVHRHALVELADARHDEPGGIVLTGRYTRIPRAYKWFRGSLVNIELGIALRSLGVAAELFGLPGRLTLPDRGSGHLLGELGLRPAWEWSLPVTIEFGAPGRTRPRGTVAHEDPPDAVLADLLRVNRAQDFDGPAANLGPAVPLTASAGGSLSWAELLWRRHSGRMPRGLHGMAGRRRPVPAAAFADALAWLAVPPPGPELRGAFEALTVTVVTQDVGGHVDGVHHIRDGEAVRYAADPAAAARLEAAYGYPLTPGNGCAVRHASMIWFLSVRPRELWSRFGDGGWSLAHYVCGWATHGLSLSAAASGLFARPVRAFHEVPAQRVLGLAPDEMIVLAVVMGTPRPTSGALLDLRL